MKVMVIVKAPARTKRSPAPLFHAVSKLVRQELWAAYAWFVAVFREASAMLRAGKCVPTRR